VANNHHRDVCRAKMMLNRKRMVKLGREVKNYTVNGINFRFYQVLNSKLKIPKGNLRADPGSWSR